MPQTAQDIWAWLVELLPVAIRPYAVFLAACIGVASGVAAAANPLIGLWHNITWNSAGRMPTEAEVLRRVMDGQTNRQDAKFILKRIGATEQLPAQRREAAVAAIRSMARSGAAEDKAALEAFARGDADKGFAALAWHLSKSARPAAAEVQRLGALAYATASKSAVAAYTKAAGSLGSAATTKAQALLAAIQKRRRSRTEGPPELP